MYRLLALFLFSAVALHAQPDLEITESGYFAMPGLNVTVFSDIYPDGHQTGVTVIQHGSRVAANGDLRLEPSPGQWSPVPRGGAQTVDREAGRIAQRLWYPDSSKDRRGFNPIIYPDLTFAYTVEVTVLTGSRFAIAVHLDEPLPAEWIGRVGFNFELFPGELFGRAWLMDGQSGIFPLQPNGPVKTVDGEVLPEPLAAGTRLVVAPGSERRRMIIASETGRLELRDGRGNHNNGWFIVRETVPEGATRDAIRWVVEPHVVEGWIDAPVVQVSQLGYHPDQPKVAVIERDPRDSSALDMTLYRLEAEGRAVVRTGRPQPWGDFLRYRYLRFDFSDVTAPGMYLLTYGDTETHPFAIDPEIYDRHVWQPVLEYFLPVQMCHMRVNEKYRVWHDACHLDDARMAPTDSNHFDGYVQGPSTLTDHEPGAAVPGLNHGGWHDAGDYDLRVESQIGTIWNLAVMVEEFGLDADATRIDYRERLVEIHDPDGVADALQQIEHGLLSVLGGYRALDRLYRGIICPDLRQYVMLGDAAAMTDNRVHDPALEPGERTATHSARTDDRWVFTEDNPGRELQVAAGLAAAFRVLGAHNPGLALEALAAAVALYDGAASRSVGTGARVAALTELFLATGEARYHDALVDLREAIIADLSGSGWRVGRVIDRIADADFRSAMRSAVGDYQARLVREQAADSPYGVPYTPHIWGAGWGIQRFGVAQYFFHRGWPDLCEPALFVNALNFILGVHPGRNTAAFASGVGANSVTTAYGVNRADWSFIPGGVASGTALIRPDLPELKVWPFFWQQTEYVMGGGATDYMFLVLAVDALYGGE